MVTAATNRQGLVLLALLLARELLRAALERSETVTTDDIIARIEAAGGSAERKARNLLAQVTASNERHPGHLVLMASAIHPDVAAAVERVTSRRIGYVARLLREACCPGHPGRGVRTSTRSPTSC